MPSRRSTKRDVGKLVKHYVDSRHTVELFHKQLITALQESAELSLLVHSIRGRLKDPDHLREKLLRKLSESRETNKPFKITTDNLFTEVNDLSGIRILHLYTRQISKIDEALRKIFDESKYRLVEGPFARTWDDESREFFESCNIKPEKSPSLYTSVHYVIENSGKTKATAEIQVRTLMEEVWGEVDHTIRYPNLNPGFSCEEQLKVLARVTSSATRLVDSIFRTLDDQKKPQRKARTPKRPT